MGIAICRETGRFLLISIPPIHRIHRNEAAALGFWLLPECADPGSGVIPQLKANGWELVAAFQVCGLRERPEHSCADCATGGSEAEEEKRCQRQVGEDHAGVAFG